MRFEFATATKILFGPGSLSEIGPLAKEFGRRALVVTGRDVTRADPLFRALSASNLTALSFSITGEPTTDRVREGTECAREGECEMVIAFGGGSTMDAGKAIAVLSSNGGDPLDYIEVIGNGRTLARPSLPLIAIPTTAGTGAEVTRNAVLGSPEHQIKASLRSPFMLARLALVDPDLTLSLSPSLTAATGMDALTQLIEPYVSNRANPLTDSICREGMARVARSLHHAFRCGGDKPAREDMAMASLFGGLALANAGLGAVHGLASPLGGLFPAPHGAVCAALLPHVMAVNIQAMESRTPRHPTLRRYEEIARILTGKETASINEGVAWVNGLCRDLGCPGLSTFGVTRDAFVLVTENALRASSMKGNPVMLTPPEVEEILVRAL